MSQERLDRISDLLSTIEDYYRVHYTSVPASFNLFNLFNARQKEAVQSRLLYWLLDPRGSHRQGSIFLERFLDLLHLDVRNSDLHRCYVGEEAEVTESRVDIILFVRGDFLIFVECKVLAGEQPEQIDREFRDLRRTGRNLHIPEHRQVAVFLTPDGRAPVSGDGGRWRRLSYRELAEQFRPLLPAITSEKVRYVLEDWMAVISSFEEG